MVTLCELIKYTQLGTTSAENLIKLHFKLNGKCIRHSDPIRTFERSTTLAQRGTNSFQFRFFWILVIIPIRSPLRYSNLTHSHHSPAVQFRVMHKTY